jgi:deazaflavin-dependent oxidoreductase (nitroreductase family)
MFDPQIRAALERDLTIDITTTGRKTGRRRRTEIWFHRVNGRYYITGIPGRRDWYANLLADPRLTFHLKESVRADLPAIARPVLDPDEKRRVLLRAETVWRRPDERNVEEWVRRSPLVEVVFEGRDRSSGLA